jgi:radical SAM superfamily enzyme YgiQ (UPF0313 family)
MSVNNRKKVVLYYANPLSRHRKLAFAPLALLAISKFVAKTDIKIVIVTDYLHKDSIEVILRECKDAICLGVTSMSGDQIVGSLRASKKVKEKYPELPIVWGGWHPSLEPTQTLENSAVDIVVKGTGERTFSELIQRLESEIPYNDIPGISYKVDGKIRSNPDRPFEDINNFPPMPYDLIDMEKFIYNTEYGKRTLNFISSYGCPHKCAFCEEQSISKRRWTGLNADRLVDEIEFLVKRYKLDAIAFHDSNFFVSKDRVRQFCKKLIERKLGIRWGNANGRTRHIAEFEDSLWQLMKDSGLSLILTGAESGYQEMLDLIDKETTVEDTINFARKCRKYGIKAIYSLFVGLPWSKDDNVTHDKIIKEFEHTLRLAEQLVSLSRKNRVILSLYTPYPGSPLYKRSVALGLRPPTKLQDWSAFQLEYKTTPWVTDKQANFVEFLTRYVFFFLDEDSYGWVTARVKNVPARVLFKLVFRVFEQIVELRWKHKFFNFRADYQLYLVGRNYFSIA